MMITMILFLRRTSRGSKRRGRMHIVFLACVTYPNNKNTQLSQRKKEKTKEGKKMYLGFQIFFEKEETKERREHTSFISRESSTTLAPSLQNRRNAHVMSAGMPYGLQAMLKVRKMRSLFLSYVYVLFDACFYDNEKKRCVCFFHDECVPPPSSK